MRTFVILLILFLTVHSNAQYYRYSNTKCNCVVGSSNPYFDKAQIESYFKSKIPQEKIRSLNGKLFLQIYIDKKGNACCKSIRNTTDSDISDLKLFSIVSQLPKWKPALFAGEVIGNFTPKKNEPLNSSLAMELKFSNLGLQIDTTSIDSLDLQNEYSTDEVEIDNKRFIDNKHKPKVLCEVFNKDNSRMPWDYSRAISIDKQNTIWCGTENGLLKIQNNKMSVLNYKNSPLKMATSPDINGNLTSSILCSAVDSLDNKWFSTGYSLYKLNNTNWTVFDTTSLPIQWCTHITSHKGSTYFATYKGVLVYNNGDWSSIDSAKYKLPSAIIYSIFIDSKENKWIGTRNGNVCIHDGASTNLENTDSTLKSASISCAAEDNDNNIWFGLDNSDDKGGIAVLSKNGDWKIFNITNSNIPGNTILDIKIDNERNVIWMSIAGVGIVLYDKKDWYAYTRNNSKVPSTNISKIELDKNGDLWGATSAGLLHIKLLN